MLPRHCLIISGDSSEEEMQGVEMAFVNEPVPYVLVMCHFYSPQACPLA